MSAADAPRPTPRAGCASEPSLWPDHLLSVEEFKALLRELIYAYAKAAPHPIGSGPEAITLGEAACRAQVRVVEAYAGARRLADREPVPPASAPAATPTCAECRHPAHPPRQCHDCKCLWGKADRPPAATPEPEMTWQCANCHAVLPVSPIIAERGGPMRCTACDGKGTKHYDRRPAAPTGEEAETLKALRDAADILRRYSCRPLADDLDAAASRLTAQATALAADQAIATAARAFFDRWVATQPPGRAFPWMPHDLLTALVEDYDRRHPTTGAAPA